MYALTFSLLPFLECKMQQKSHGKNLMQSFLKLTWTYTSNPADFGEMNDKNLHFFRMLDGSQKASTATWLIARNCTFCENKTLATPSHSMATA